MKKIHPSTTFGLILNISAIVMIILGMKLVAASLALVAYFASIKEVSKYTSWYQFANVFAAAIIAGLAIDLQIHHSHFIMLALLFAALGSILRIVMFTTFSYTGHSWFEPTMFVLALFFYLIGNLKGHYDWTAWAFPAPILLFTAILAWGILKDKKQLLAYTKGGYKVQIGRPATEFSLPDQDGNMVNLSDFKGKRHLLLIFVRGDWCPGCHMMLRTYEKNREKFQQKNILVMAIGPDPVGVNRGMVEKLDLEFKVLSDEGQRTAMTYGVQLKEYNNDFAEKYEEGIPLPASFLIDDKGIVRYVSRPDKVGEFLNPSMIFPIVEKLS
jgi:thioredoxin-dependent peroxiredoxin